jgi:DNA-directed RNA polymerase subunit N (RpoN/RPB10)
MSLERELRKDWDSVFYPAPDPIVEQAPAPGTSQAGDVLVAEAGSRGLPESAYSGEVQAEMKSFDPTTRVQIADKLQSVLESLGVDRYIARRNAQSFIGGASSNLPAQMGLVDALAMLPGIGTAIGTAMLPMYVEEGALAIEEGIKSAEQGDLVSAGIETAVGALNVLPGAQAAKDVSKRVVKKAKSLVKEAK